MAGKKNKKTTTNTVRSLYSRHFKGKPKLLKMLKEEQERAEVAVQIYALRTKAGLTQAQLAKRIDTTQSVISLLENADYNGHSLTTLRRVADALNCRLDLKITPRHHGGRGHSNHRSHAFAAAAS